MTSLVILVLHSDFQLRTCLNDSPSTLCGVLYFVAQYPSLGVPHHNSFSYFSEIFHFKIELFKIQLSASFLLFMGFLMCFYLLLLITLGKGPLLCHHTNTLLSKIPQPMVLSLLWIGRCWYFKQ